MVLPQVTLRRPVAVDAVGVYALNGIPDPNQTSLFFSGLSVETLYAGSPVSLVFTVSHAGTPLEIFPAADSFAGVVTDGSGVVLGITQPEKVTLKFGQYTAVKVVTGQPLPSSVAGSTITGIVAPATLLATATLGEPFYAPTASLAATAQVQFGANPNPNPPPPGPTPTPINPVNIPGSVIAVGAGVVLIGGAILLFRHGPSVAAYAHERGQARERTRREELRLQQEEARASAAREQARAVRAAATAHQPRGHVIDVEALPI